MRCDLDNNLNYEELVVFRLRSIYGSYGYLPYKMNKFEEYDLYAENRRFLTGQSILTFTDNHGKLMALKPDVTLSIIKNYNDSDSAVSKVFYDERVYRASGYNGDFQEITQTGLECMGRLDAYTVAEVVSLALMSLDAISPDFVLDISHTGVIEGLLDSCGLSPLGCEDLISAVGRKSTGEISALCEKYAVDGRTADALCSLVRGYSPLPEAIVKLRAFGIPSASGCADELSRLWELICSSPLADKVYADFSILSEPEYYDGIVMKGYVSGAPSPVLSGGRYDRLMEKLGKKAGAIGFAVYMDMLERLGMDRSPYDVDVLLLYDEDTDPSALFEAADAFRKTGLSVRAATGAGGVRYKTMYRMNGSEAELI